MSKVFKVRGTRTKLQDILISVQLHPRRKAEPDMRCESENEGELLWHIPAKPVVQWPTNPDTYAIPAETKPNAASVVLRPQTRNTFAKTNFPP